MNRVMIAYIKAVKVWYTLGIPYSLLNVCYEKYYNNYVQVLRWGVLGLISTIILIYIKEMEKMLIGRK